jgi:hypothetical protein
VVAEERPFAVLDARHDAAGGRVGDRDELGGRAHRQRPEEQRVHHAEERGVGADPERERDDGDRGQALVTGQRAHAVEQILA